MKAILISIPTNCKHFCGIFTFNSAWRHYFECFATQSIQVTWSQIFGGHVLFGRNPEDVLELLSGLSSGGCYRITILHRLIACSINGVSRAFWYKSTSNIEKGVGEWAFWEVDIRERYGRILEGLMKKEEGRGPELYMIQELTGRYRWYLSYLRSDRGGGGVYQYMLNLVFRLTRSWMSLLRAQL